MRNFLCISTLAYAIIAAGQTSAPTPAAPAQGAQPPAGQSTTAAPATAEITAETPVITIHGLCPATPAADPKSPDCKTVVTRAQFDQLVTTLAPNMPGAARQQLAGDYSRMLVLSNEGQKRGLDKTKRFDEILAFMKMRVLAQEFLTDLQEKSKPTAAQVEKYYQDNKGTYEELTLNRLFIPRNRPAPSTPKAAEPKPLTDAELQAQADKLRARLVAGESFDKLQKEVYAASGFKTPPPPTTTQKRREGLPPAEQELFALKKSDFSKVIMDGAGASIYQVQDTNTVPLEEVKPQIESQLASENMRQEMEKVTGVVKPEMNQAYFQSFRNQEPAGSIGPAGMPRPGMPRSATPPKPAAHSASPASAKPSTPKTTTATPQR
jgi:hypothetical protein